MGAREKESGRSWLFAGRCRASLAGSVHHGTQHPTTALQKPRRRSASTAGEKAVCARAKPASASELRNAGSRVTRRSSAASSAVDPSLTMIPASPTTSGMAPESLAITGTPDAMASVITRPNCSHQSLVVKRRQDQRVERRHHRGHLLERYRADEPDPWVGGRGSADCALHRTLPDEYQTGVIGKAGGFPRFQQPGDSLFGDQSPDISDDELLVEPPSLSACLSSPFRMAEALEMR